MIDCTDFGHDDHASEAPTCTSTTPPDLTGVGICLSKGYDQFGTPGGQMVLLDNLSTLLVYSEVDRVVRFVSTINNRIAELGDSTVQLLDTDVVDDVDKNKLLKLFSTVIQVKQADGETRFRLRGATETSWLDYPVQGENR